MDVIRVLCLLLLVSVLFFAINGCSENLADNDKPGSIKMNQLREQLQAKLGSDYNLSVAPATAGQLARGKILYQTLCSSCHGGSGKPPDIISTSLTVPPADLSRPEIVNFFSEQARLEIIRNGINGSPMKGLRGMLNEKDTVAVFMYTRTLIK